MPLKINFVNCINSSKFLTIEDNITYYTLIMAATFDNISGKYKKLDGTLIDIPTYTLVFPKYEKQQQY